MPVKHKSKRDGKVSASAAIPIATSGEVFDGAMIELVRDVTTQSLRLLLWDGAKETVGPLVEYQRRFYEPVAMSRSLLRELTLPTHSSPHGTTCALLAEICKLAADFILLPEKLASLVGRVVLASWLLEAAQIAPALAIIGPDISRGTQLLDLLHCLCRHPVRMTGVTPAGLCSLPTGLGGTLLISQPTISDKMQRLLADASRRDQKIPYRGGLLDLHGCRRSTPNQIWRMGHGHFGTFKFRYSLRASEFRSSMPVYKTGSLPNFKPSCWTSVGQTSARLAVRDLTRRASVTRCGRWFKASRPQRRTMLTCRRRWANCSGKRKRMLDLRSGWISTRL